MVSGHTNATDRPTQAEETNMPTPESPVSSVKRKIGEALSPESIESKVSGKNTTNTPMHKKRYLMCRKGKGARPKNVSRVYKAKLLRTGTAMTLRDQGKPSSVLVPDKRGGDDDDDDYDTADELPLSGLAKLRTEFKPDDLDSTWDTEPDRDADPKPPATTRSKTKKARRRSQGQLNQDNAAIMNIQSDLAEMKLDGNKRDQTLSEVNANVGKLATENVTKVQLDEVLTNLVTRISTVMDDHKINITRQDNCLKVHQKQLDNTAATLETHDARLTSLEKDIIDDLAHFKKRVDGLEYRMDKVTPPPPLLPSKGNQGRESGVQLVGTYAAALEHGVPRGAPLAESRQMVGVGIQVPPSENKSVIIEGLTEYPMENLESIVFELLREIGIPMMDCDYDKIERLGRWNPNRNWPRPIKLELVTTHKKNKILACRDYLKDTNDYYNVRLQPDEPKSIRVGRAMLRQAANKARQEGKVVCQNTNYIEINGIRYDINTINKLGNSHKSPHTTQADKKIHKPAPGNPERVPKEDEEHLKYAENLCTLDTPFGLAFYTIRSKLSNFYPCSISINGRQYKSVEHGYQAEKAIFANDLARLTAILEAKTPADAKRIGGDVVVGIKWMHVKRAVMKKLLYAKFTQHVYLGDYLCSTTGKTLIEGSRDGYWGSGVPLHSKEMMEGSWQGRNELGRLLMSIRDVIIQEREVARIQGAEREHVSPGVRNDLIMLDFTSCDGLPQPKPNQPAIEECMDTSTTYTGKEASLMDLSAGSNKSTVKVSPPTEVEKIGTEIQPSVVEYNTPGTPAPVRPTQPAEATTPSPQLLSPADKLAQTNRGVDQSVQSTSSASEKTPGLITQGEGQTCPNPTKSTTLTSLLESMNHHNHDQEYRAGTAIQWSMCDPKQVGTAHVRENHPTPVVLAISQ